MISLKQIAPEDDLGAICIQMAPNNWAKDNEMSQYKADNLRKFLESDKSLLLIAYDSNRIAGSALCYEIPHPDGEDTLYIHELDTHPDYRRQGVATQLMQELFNIAKDRGLTEVWLGADQDNPPANELYKSLRPTEIEPTITYSYKIQT